jgi:hypothetical protein
MVTTRTRAVTADRDSGEREHVLKAAHLFTISLSLTQDQAQDRLVTYAADDTHLISHWIIRIVLMLGQVWTGAPRRPVLL